ncbi:MAG TPA: indolepyruvate oxidoreductase subunit beta, partial [Magnetospirillaceae bacterium]|nr:indolepyruvate oxidoreductase subunit beta [Magnetospirillaceae bacterium]
QGTILAAGLLTAGLMEAGYDVKMSEIHGMAQRGGSVSSQVRYGDEKVHSPVIEIGGADILVAFERMEALRWLRFLKPGGKVIVNDYRINPMPVVSGRVEYPSGVLEELQALADTTVVDAAAKAAEFGTHRVMNVFLLGATIRYMGLDAIDWESLVRRTLKPASVDINIAVLRAGMGVV